MISVTTSELRQLVFLRQLLDDDDDDDLMDYGVELREIFRCRFLECISERDPAHLWGWRRIFFSGASVLDVRLACGLWEHGAAFPEAR
ncbi:hypothetical protein CEXT_497061 [Caerostris extrusa]|uniref:Uncharacterized protein n=1 Tax=Caerostris extrusa TaxID=172846 RepID=A0AAV4V3J4_CAEEX|nr:hypothetical protein CEXT_497061 [Caerostris extrusa]